MSERQRLRALEATGLLFSPAEDRFDRITRLASHIAGAPISLVTLVGETRQFFKSAHGMVGSETPREVAFCAHAIAANDRLVVEDASRDARFAANPFVTGEPHIRAYAGSLIRAPGGEPLGTLCVIDSQPRRFTEEELARLEDLAAIARDEVARSAPGVQAEYARRLATPEREQRLDLDSRCWNHDAMVEILLDQAGRAEASGERFGLVLVRVSQHAGLVERLGDDAAAGFMAEVAGALRRALGERDVVGRFDDSTFVVLLAQAPVDPAAAAARLSDAVTAKPLRSGRLSLRANSVAAAVNWSPGIRLVEMLETLNGELGRAA